MLKLNAQYWGSKNIRRYRTKVIYYGNLEKLIRETFITAMLGIV
jgi:hypothetical protein